MSEWRNEYYEANGINIHYTRTGGKKPPIILLHGLMTNGVCWTALARAIEHDYDVIMPDARGHGKSSAPNHGYRYEDHAHDIVGLIKFLKLSTPILIGHSMGGMTAAMIASLNSKLLSCLILADPTFLSPKVQREVRDSDVADQHRKILLTSLEELLASAQIKQPHRSFDTLKLLAEARLQTRMSAFDVLTPPNPDYMQLVSAIDVPSLIIIGDKGNVVCSTMAAEIQRINPKFQSAQIPNAGHGLLFDQPEQFARAIKSFLFSMM